MCDEDEEVLKVSNWAWVAHLSRVAPSILFLRRTTVEVRSPRKRSTDQAPTTCSIECRRRPPRCHRARRRSAAASSTPLGAAGGGRRGPLPDPLAHPLPMPLPTSPATPPAPTSGLPHPLAPARLWPRHWSPSRLATPSRFPLFTPSRRLGRPPFQDRVVHALLLLLLEPAGPKPFVPAGGRCSPTATRSVRSHFAALPSGSFLPTSPAVADALSPDTLYFPVVQKTVSESNAHVRAGFVPPW
uniref:Uncharacterized protein n=1 Tax=Oryza meridionalis TaxID=40149 RepID=A0A0E0DWK6_9ORYZ